MSDQARFLAYRTADGELHDEGLHDEILAGYHDVRHTYARLQVAGWTREEIDEFLDGEEEET